MSDALRVKAAGESLTLLPPGVVWWAKRKTLFVADVHLDALPRPSGRDGADFDEDLETLSALAREWNAERIVVLGDFFHTPGTLTDAQLEHAHAWRAALATPVWLVLGTHEGELLRRPDLAPFDRIEPRFTEEPFVFVHEPGEEEGFRMCGYLHPVARLEETRTKMRMRCFVRESHQLILPSFGRMTGGTDVEGAPGRSRYPVTGDAVLDLGI